MLLLSPFILLKEDKIVLYLQDNCSNSTYLNLTAQSHFNIVINIQLLSNLEQMARELFHFLPTRVNFFKTRHN